MKRWLALCMLILALAVGMFSEAHASRAEHFFESLKHTKGRFYNQPFVLLPWERQIIRDVYGTLREDGTRQYRYVYLEIPKKNGKSELAAGAALYHTFADGEKSGEIYGCAADRKQAGIVYKVARDMIELVPALKKRAKITDSLKIIRDRVSHSEYIVLSAEAYTKHGLNLSACIFDELHAQPSRDLWDVMTFEAGAARAQPIWWVITTAGDDPDRVSIAWEQHDYAMRILSGEIVDPTWYVVVYNYEGDDIYNEANWRRSNPSLGTVKSLESMREAAHAARLKPANERLFRWMDLNQWLTYRLTSWLPLDLFDATAGDWSRADLLGDCYMGLDLSSTTDLSGLCLVFPPQGSQSDWRVIWEAWIPEENMQERVKADHVPYDLWASQGWLTPTPGDVIDYTRIEARINELRRLYNVIELDADRAMATMLLQRLEQQGLTCVDVPQTYASLSDPMNLIEVLLKGRPEQDLDHDPGHEGENTEENVPLVSGPLLSGRMTHEGSPVARWCFGNTSVAKNGQGYIKFVKLTKGKSVERTKRIDLICAWVDAMARARYYQSSVDLSAQILSGDWGM